MKADAGGDEKTNIQACVALARARASSEGSYSELALPKNLAASTKALSHIMSEDYLAVVRTVWSWTYLSSLAGGPLILNTSFYIRLYPRRPVLCNNHPCNMGEYCPLTEQSDCSYNSSQIINILIALLGGQYGDIFQLEGGSIGPTEWRDNTEPESWIFAWLRVVQ